MKICCPNKLIEKEKTMYLHAKACKVALL